MKGWGLKALADAIGVEESTIWRLESGMTKAPKFETRAGLAKKLGVSEGVLFDTVGK